MISPGLSINGRAVTPQTRFDYLCEIERHLSRRTDQKMVWGCHDIHRKVSHVKGAVLAQTLGIIPRDASVDIERRAYRWLFAHTHNARDKFNIDIPGSQWNKIVRNKFLGDVGKYAELAVLERILINVLKPQGSGVSISDIFGADAVGDEAFMTDWIMHQQCMHGVIQWGIQLGIGRFITKQHDLNKRYLHDREFLDRNVPRVVKDFLRHTTIVLSLPSFKVGKPVRESAFQHLLGGSIRYQSEHVAGKCSRDFTHFGASFLRAMEFFQTGVKSRLIDSHYQINHHTFAHSDPNTGEIISCRIWSNEGVPTLDIKMTEAPRQKIKVHSADRPKVLLDPILKMSIPIPSDFLDIMRDYMGVRAQ